MVFGEEMAICSGLCLKMSELLKIKTQTNKGVLFKVNNIVPLTLAGSWLCRGF